MLVQLALSKERSTGEQTLVVVDALVSLSCSKHCLQTTAQLHRSTRVAVAADSAAGLDAPFRPTTDMTQTAGSAIRMTTHTCPGPRAERGEGSERRAADAAAGLRRSERERLGRSQCAADSPVPGALSD